MSRKILEVPEYLKTTDSVQLDDEHLLPTCVPMVSVTVHIPLDMYQMVVNGNPYAAEDVAWSFVRAINERGQSYEN